MAQKIQVVLVDDLDGSQADGTVRFALDGTDYEIDLSAEHARALRNSLARCVAAARRAGSAEPHRGPGVGQGAGIEVKDRGRVPADLVARFKAATGK